MKVHINVEQKLFAIEANGGVTCLGFDDAQRDARYVAERYVAERLQRPDLAPTVAEYGTLAGYLKYGQALRAWGMSSYSADTWFTPGTPQAVQDILEKYRHSKKLLRVFYGDHESGRDWMEEHDVVGFVGRSMGTIRVPLLVPPRQNGGPAILDHCIVRLMDGRSGKELYRIPNYLPPSLSFRLVTDEKMLRNGLRTEVLDGKGKVLARFPSVFRAAEYVEFITGAIPAMRSNLEDLAAA